MRRLWAGLGALALMCGAGVVAQDGTHADAVRLYDKLVAIVVRGMEPLPDPVRTELLEREINAYLTHQSADQFPVGVTRPRIALLDEGRVRMTAVVDLDMVRKAESRGVLDPLRYASGTVEVAAVGILRTSEGRATYHFESGAFGRLPLPRAVLHELVAFYTRSPELPEGLDLSAPFDLPARIREIHLRQGAAMIVQ